MRSDAEGVLSSRGVNYHTFVSWLGHKKSREGKKDLVRPSTKQMLITLRLIQMADQLL